MAEKTILKIIKELEYILQPIKNLESKLMEDFPLDAISGFKEFKLYNGFKNPYMQKTVNPIEPQMHIVGKSRDLRRMHLNIMIGFDNEDMEKIRSPSDGIEALAWLDKANNMLVNYQYNGIFNHAGYTKHRAQSYTYNVHTRSLEEFKRTLVQFKAAFQGEEYI